MTEDPNGQEESGFVARTQEGPATTENAGKEEKRKKKRRVRYCLITASIALCSFGGGILVRQLALDPQMRSLIRLKNRIQNSYYYEVSDEEFYDTLFDAVSDGLLDDYSLYLSADEYAQTRASAKGEQSGLGLVFTTQTPSGEDQLYVSRVCGNSPAEEAGITAGDYVTGFGKNETEITQSTAFDELSSFLSDYSAGETFYLQVVSNGETHLIPVSKEEYVESYVFYRTNETAYGFTGNKADTLIQKGEPLEALENDTAYIRLTQFNGGAATEFKKAMELFREQGKKNLVLDLRGNGGGYLDIMREIASYFCKDSNERTPLAAVADYGDHIDEFDATGNYYDDYFQEESRICVLADNRTASASECLLGVMLDYGAIVYDDICLSERNGEAKTYGKGIMQTTYPLGGTNGDAVKLTTARICWPKGNCIHGVGVIPENGALVVEEAPTDDQEITAAIETLGLKKQ